VTVLKSRELAHHVQDDAFHEIQLNGKQLVFLFMVTTVVLAVAFLSGVFVGRGVSVERAAAMAEAGAVAPVTTPDVLASPEVPPTDAGSDPTAAPPPPAVDELSYFSRLERQGQADEDLNPAASAASPPAAAARTENEKPRDIAPPPAPKPDAAARATPSLAADANASATPAAAAASADASLAEPSGQGFVLQVSALNERGPAELIAKRLSAKGYAAYVTTPATGAASKLYRVRIGKFKTRREAEEIAAKVQKEEQIQPWITR
jgi:cell division septation protein DedD